MLHEVGTAVASVQVGGGGTKVHAWERTGVPPVHPVGDEVATVRVWVLFDWHAPQAE